MKKTEALFVQVYEKNAVSKQVSLFVGLFTCRLIYADQNNIDYNRTFNFNNSNVSKTNNKSNNIRNSNQNRSNSKPKINRSNKKRP